jgi:hypothetical protein
VGYRAYNGSFCSDPSSAVNRLVYRVDAMRCARGEDAGDHRGALATCPDYKVGTAMEYRVYKDPMRVCKVLIGDADSRAPFHA